MSIRLRLAIWYSAIFGVALTLFGVTLYVFMDRHLDNMLRDAVNAAAGHVSTVMSGPPGAIDRLQAPPLDAFQSPDVYIQVVGPDGALLARSSNLGGRTIPVADGVLAAGLSEVVLGGQRLKQATFPVTVGGSTVAWVQAAGGYRQRDMVLGRLRLVLIAAGLLSVAFAGALAFALAGRALRPVATMTETARAIALSRGFARRLQGGSATDELGQLAQTFNEMLASLEDAYAAQRRFTADASHELRAPLTAIRGNLDLLDRVRDMPEEERRHTLAQLRGEVERLSRLVHDLLGLARADAGQTVAMEPVELDALLVEVHRQALSMSDGVTVRIGRIEPVVVTGDRDRLKEVLLILADNAIRYTPGGGSVSLSLRRQPPWVVATV
ncbi:MAG: HAMP domain-containing sensor histidine kinase [Dehalococcoidia bacterium]